MHIKHGEIDRKSLLDKCVCQMTNTTSLLCLSGVLLRHTKALTMIRRRERRNLTQNMNEILGQGVDLMAVEPCMTD